MNVFQVCADPGIPAMGTKGASVHLRAFGSALAVRGHIVTSFLAAGDTEGFPVPGRAITALSAVSPNVLPDVVHERYALGHTDGLDFARRHHRPFVLEVNAPLVAEAREHRPRTVAPEDAVAERCLLRRADLVVTVSQPLRRWVADVRGRDEGVAVLSNGCDPAHFPVAAPIDERSVPTVAFLGHPKPWHGAELLPELLRRLHDRGCRVRLLLVGGGKGGEAVSRVCADMGLADWVEMTGALPTAVATSRLREAWVGVAPYPRRTPFYFSPLKVVEYLAAGLPVVTTAQGDLPALVAGAGRLTDPDDVDSLTTAVAELLADPAQARAIGRAGRRRVLAELSWDSVAARWEALVAPLVGRRAA